MPTTHRRALQKATKRLIGRWGAGPKRIGRSIPVRAMSPRGPLGEREPRSAAHGTIELVQERRAEISAIGPNDAPQPETRIERHHEQLYRARRNAARSAF